MEILKSRKRPKPVRASIMKLSKTHPSGLRISSFEKPDAESLEGGQMIMMTKTIDDDAEPNEDGSPKVITKTMGHGMSNVLVVLEVLHLSIHLDGLKLHLMDIVQVS